MSITVSDEVIEFTPGTVVIRNVDGQIVAHSDMSLDEVQAAFGNPDLGPVASFWLGLAFAARRNAE